jgi:hypothetical protein
VVDVTISEVGEITDPKLRKVLLPVVRQVELAALRVAAHHHQPAGFALPKSAGSLERVLDTRFQSLPAAKKANAANKALVHLTRPKKALADEFGPLADVDLASDEPIDALAAEAEATSAVRMTIDEMLKAVGAPTVTGPTRAVPLDKLELRLHKVHCVDETGTWPEIGADEIWLGGTEVDEDGATRKIAPFKVRNFGDDGDTKTYVPPQRMTWFNLQEGKVFPKSYFMTFVLAEVDMGGLPEFIDKLWNVVKGKVIAAVAAAIGGLIGSTGGPLGTVIGIAVGWAVGKAYEWFKTVWEDDVFPPVVARIDVPTLTHRFTGGSTNSTDKVAVFSGHNGKYELTYDWRMFT